MESLRSVVVGRLPHETVLEVVSRFSLNADSLTFKQRDLLSVPLHLKLLSELAADVEIRRLNFETAQDLYERFWVYNVSKSIRERVGQPVQWIQVVYGLCNYIHEQQILNAPEVVVEEWSSDAPVRWCQRMFWSSKTSDTHSSTMGFFDYAFARRFAGSSQSLLHLLVSGEQRLFRRAQVRQVLLYLRDTEFDRYISNLKEVLTSPDVRFHIKQVVLALLADAVGTCEERMGRRILPCWERLSVTSVTRQTWMPCAPTLAWFRLVDSLGLVQQWLDRPG